MAVRAGLRAGPMVLVVLVCSTCADRPETEAGVFFPTWNADGPRPTGVVQGTLLERDDCLFLASSSGLETLIVWDEGYAFADGSLLDASGEPIASLGETLHGGGGYYGRAHAEEVSGASIPSRCVPDHVEAFALIYGVEAGPFE